MKYNIDQINRTIERASKLYSTPTSSSYLSQRLNVLKDFRDKLEVPHIQDLSSRQINYLENLMEMFSDENLSKQENWAKHWNTDKSIRERGDVVSKYYISQNSWFMAIAKTVQRSLTMGDVIPDYHMFQRMIINEYADKVWESHKSEHRWKAGELVCCRSNAKIDGWTYSIRTQGIDVCKDPCMVIESGSKPISNAAKYDEKRGGCRWVSINPIGTTYIFHVMEKDLKIYRQPKKKATKRSRK